MNTRGNDTLGFSVYPIPLGNRELGGRFWSIDDDYSDGRSVGTFYVDFYSAGVGGNPKNDYRSVRCIKDED
jgi:hypothetical protein